MAKQIIASLLAVLAILALSAGSKNDPKTQMAECQLDGMRHFPDGAKAAHASSLVDPNVRESYFTYRHYVIQCMLANGYKDDVRSNNCQPTLYTDSHFDTACYSPVALFDSLLFEISLNLERKTPDR